MANTQPKLRTNSPKIANKQTCEQTGVSNSGPPNAVIAKGISRGNTPKATVTKENSLVSLFKKVRVFKGSQTNEVCRRQAPSVLVSPIDWCCSSWSDSIDLRS